MFPFPSWRVTDTGKCKTGLPSKDAQSIRCTLIAFGVEVPIGSHRRFGLVTRYGGMTKVVRMDVTSNTMYVRSI